MSDRFSPRSLQIAAMWVFLAPLMLILATADVVTGGRSRNWPLGELPRGR